MARNDASVLSLLLSSINALPFLSTCQCHLINWLACMIIPELIAFTPLLFFFIFFC